MKTTDFTSLLQNPQNITVSKTSELENIVTNFPYFQAARALYLKGLKQQESFQYNQQLKKTAAYTTDRSVLFDFITSESFSIKNNTKEETIIKEIEVIDAQIIQALHKEPNKDKDPVSEETAIAKTILETQKPLPFKVQEGHSFNEWLQLTNIQPIQRTVLKKPSKLEIIDTFIEKKPKIPTLHKKSNNNNTFTQKTNIDNALMTETLAKVYVAQEKFENAITAYRILSLKYPEKSGFFADQIKAIQILQKNKA